MAIDIRGSIKAKFSKENKELIDTLKNIFGFYPGNIFLYQLAFRHKSVADELQPGVKNSNERLEFLGDAILDAVVADYLFKIFPYKDEGFLTKMRSKMVSRSQLNALSTKLGITGLIQATKDVRSQPKSLRGDAFEAFIGALYIDKGYEFTKKVIIERIIKLHLDVDELQKTETNFKSRLIEWAQKQKHQVEFKSEKQTESGNKILHKVDLYIDGELISTASDYSIKAAEQRAAEIAYQNTRIFGAQEG